MPTSYSSGWQSRKASAKALADFEASFAKDMGVDISRGSKIVPYEVIPTGSLALDDALKVGGYPRGRIIEAWGPEHAGKSSLAMMAVASAQRLFPDKVAAWVDMEQTLDAKWATALGVDMSRLLLVANPHTAEDVADATKRFMHSGLCSIVVLDSVGGMITRAEFEKESDEATVAAVARVVTRMVKQCSPMGTANGTTLFVVNQVRCLGEGTRISTRRGLIPVEDILPGDRVWSGTGEVEVQHVAQSGDVHGVTVDVKFRPSIRLSDLHRQVVVGVDGNYEEKLGNELEVGDWLVTPMGSVSVERAEYLPENVAAMLGLHFADGTIYVDEYPSELSVQRTTRVSVSERNEERREIAHRVMSRFFGFVSSMGQYTWQVSSSAQVAKLDRWGVGRRGDDKIIPEVIFRSSDASVLEFLRYASFDTHGFSFKGFIWTGENKSHLEGIHFLLRRFGIFSDLRLDLTKKGDFWRLHVTGVDATLYRDLIGFAEPSKMNLAQMFSGGDGGARGKYDVVPPFIVRAVFDLVHEQAFGWFWKLPHAQAHQMVLRNGLNGSRQRLLEFAYAAEDQVPEVKSWIGLLEEHRYTQILSVTPSRFTAYDLQVEGGLFVAAGILTHNSNIGTYGGSTTRTGGFALGHISTIRLNVRRGKEQLTIRSNGIDQPVGHEVVVKVEKNKVAPYGAVANFFLINLPTEKYGPIGVDKAAEAFEYGKRLDIIAGGGGGRYVLPNENKITGGSNVIAYLRTDPVLVEQIRAALLEAHKHQIAEQPDIDDEIVAAMAKELS